MLDVGRVELVDLLHPDARLEGGEEVAHELSEVDAQRGVVIDGDLVPVELVLNIHHGHRQTVRVDRQVLAGLSVKATHKRLNELGARNNTL